MPTIDKKLVDRLAKLARFDFESEKEKEALVGDFNKIIDYFKKLEKVDTSEALPVIGGGLNENEKRDDTKNDLREEFNKTSPVFPEKEDGYNKIPPVFE